VSNQTAPPLGPPSDLSWPPELPGDGSPGRKSFGWAKWLTALSVLVIVIAVAGTVIRLPYDTLAPGGTLNLETRVSAPGTKTYPTRGSLMLLFVSERAHVNVWGWLQAKLDPDIDLIKQVQVNGGNSQQETDQQDVCDMAQAQSNAKVAALSALGYHVPTVPGLAVIDLFAGLPAVKVLRPCDHILAADGHDVTRSTELSKILKSHPVGSTVALRIERAGQTMTVRVPVTSSQNTHIIGVELSPRFKIPVNINLDTSAVSGPSGGLAMSLAIIDALTPGDLTGGKQVAVTGTIDPDGNVGEIGGLPQKAVVARRAHAQIFLVPACTDDGCRQDLATARKRVGKNVELRPVATLAQALQVLRDAGGAPVPALTKT